MSVVIHVYLTVVLIVLALLVIACLIRALTGAKIADKVVAANMMGTIVIVMIAILAVFLGEGYLSDICIIYALVSFLAVIILTKIYSGIYREQHSKEKEDEEQ